jgi:hypothetical protein
MTESTAFFAVVLALQLTGHDLYAPWESYDVLSLCILYIGRCRHEDLSHRSKVPPVPLYDPHDLGRFKVMMFTVPDSFLAQPLDSISVDRAHSRVGRPKERGLERLPLPR